MSFSKMPSIKAWARSAFTFRYPAPPKIDRTAEPEILWAPTLHADGAVSGPITAADFEVSADSEHAADDDGQDVIDMYCGSDEAERTSVAHSSLITLRGGGSSSNASLLSLESTISIADIINMYDSESAETLAAAANSTASLVSADLPPLSARDLHAKKSSLSLALDRAQARFTELGHTWQANAEGPRRDDIEDAWENLLLLRHQVGAVDRALADVQAEMRTMIWLDDLEQGRAGAEEFVDASESDDGFEVASLEPFLIGGSEDDEESQGESEEATDQTEAERELHLDACYDYLSDGSEDAHLIDAAEVESMIAQAGTEAEDLDDGDYMDCEALFESGDSPYPSEADQLATAQTSCDRATPFEADDIPFIVSRGVRRYRSQRQEWRRH